MVSSFQPKLSLRGRLHQHEAINFAVFCNGALFVCTVRQRAVAKTLSIGFGVVSMFGRLVVEVE